MSDWPWNGGDMPHAAAGKGNFKTCDGGKPDVSRPSGGSGVGRYASPVGPKHIPGNALSKGTNHGVGGTQGRH